MERCDFEQRALLYELLSSLFLKEADKIVLHEASKLNYAEFNGRTTMDKGFKLLKKALVSMDESSLVSLSIDFVRLFDGVGPEKTNRIIPFESAYKGEKILKKTLPLESVDHISFELQHMSSLCLKAARTDVDSGHIYTIQQYEYLDKHLSTWVGRFCDDVIKHSREDFYKATALITKGFINADKRLLKKILG